MILRNGNVEGRAAVGIALFGVYFYIKEPAHVPGFIHGNCLDQSPTTGLDAEAGQFTEASLFPGIAGRQKENGGDKEDTPAQTGDGSGLEHNSAS